MQRSTLAILLLTVFPMCACGGDSTDDGANGVQAATRSAVESAEAASKTAIESIQRAAESLDLSGMTPEAAKQKVQQLLDRAQVALAEAKDSEMVQQTVAALETLLDRLEEMRQSAATKIDVQKLQTGVQEQIQRFRDDPRVQSALKTLQEKLSQFAR